MSQSNHNWKPCREGQLGGLVDGLKTSQDRATMTRRVALAGGLLAVLCGVIVAAGMLGAPKPIAMACSEVKALTAKFVSGTLDDERTAGVRAHLASCPHCDAHMKNAKEAFERQSEITVASR